MSRDAASVAPIDSVTRRLASWVAERITARALRSRKHAQAASVSISVVLPVLLAALMTLMNLSERAASSWWSHSGRPSTLSANTATSSAGLRIVVLVERDAGLAHELAMALGVGLRHGVRHGDGAHEVGAEPGSAARRHAEGVQPVADLHAQAPL